MSIITRTPAQRSWAEIVKGVDSATTNMNDFAEGGVLDFSGDFFASSTQQQEQFPTPSRKVFKPGVRGAMTCLCYGRLLVILGHYGWIEARGTVDHPYADKNGGRIYVRWRDVVGDVREGQIVCFYLYADGQGLGAERCQAALACDLKKIGSLPEDGEEFVHALRVLQNPAFEAYGLKADAEEFVPSGSESSDPESDSDEVDRQVVSLGTSSELSADAAEFVPMDYSSKLTSMGLAVASPITMPTHQSYGDAVCARIADLFCDDSDDDSDDEFKFRSRMPHTKKSPRAASSDDSTSMGEQSDSDSCDSDVMAPLTCFRPPPGLSLQPPPGLSLIPHPSFIPPPGLA